MKWLKKLLMLMKRKIQTNFFCKSNYWPKRMSKINQIVKKILKIEDISFNKKIDYILNFIFIDDKKIKLINKTYRKKNKPTDVLTFVIYSKNHFNKIEAYCDIFFAAETIKKDANKNFTNFYDHLTHLIIHCFLHINGYSHKKKSQFVKMKKLEEKILMQLNIPSPYYL